jgi:hypothetical protein
MLKKLLGMLAGANAGLTTPPSAAQSPSAPPSPQRDPLAGAKLGAQAVFEQLLRAMKNDQGGVHAESLLCALGALAGYACQASLRADALAKGLPEQAYLTQVDTRDGKKFFFGDALNKPLAESALSVWNVAAGAARQAGCATVPDLAEIFRHSSQVVGSPDFGVPRLPAGHPTGDMPINYVRAFWPALLPEVTKYCATPDLWPVVFALAIVHAITVARSTLDPCVGLTIVMESAVPMSKIDLSAS